jgi:transposase-like protein
VVVRFSEEDKATIWEMRQAGVPVKQIAKHVGRQNSSLRTFISGAGRCPSSRGRSELRLCWEEREEVSRGVGRGSVVADDRSGAGSVAVDGLSGGECQWRP